MKLIINEHEANAVRLIFQLTLDGNGYEKIIQALRFEGYKTKRGGDFGKNGLHSILRNEKYCGVYIYSKSAPKGVDGKRNGHAYKDPSDIIRIEGAVPQLISEADFKAVQEIMARRKHQGNKYKAKSIFLLSGKIICGECGSTYAGNTRCKRPDHPEYVSYDCVSRNGAVKCRNGGLRSEALEGHVLNKLADLVFDDKSIPEIVSSYNAYIASRDIDLINEIQALQKRLGTIQKELNNIVNVIALTGSTELASRLKELEGEKSDLVGQIEEVKAKTETSSISEDEIASAFKRARALLKAKNLPDIQSLINSFVDKVIVYGDRIEVKFNIGFDSDFCKEKPHDVTVESSHHAESSFCNAHTRVHTVGGEGGI